jgi:putative acetyltransferase
MLIRPERPEDAAAIRKITEDAFRDAPYSAQTEAAIIDALRAAGALTLSLVADEGGIVIGHVAFSPVKINRLDAGWFGLGPVSVTPARQRQGIGQGLIRAGLDWLRASGAAGCVVLGEPDYYGRFGFVSDPELTYAEVPPAYFQRLSFQGGGPSGTVTYHPAFAAR